MRGKPQADAVLIKHKRITPADAGKTGFIHRPLAALRDHPRGCGENGSWPSVGFSNLGSPPRMRGKLVYVDIRQAAVRITPADAGKTFSVAVSSLIVRDHPRGCGENSPMPMFADSAAGSPPRMRGKRCTPSKNLRIAGITPADAGKTIIFALPTSRFQDHPRGCGENMTGS